MIRSRLSVCHDEYSSETVADPLDWRRGTKCMYFSGTFLFIVNEWQCARSHFFRLPCARDVYGRRIRAREADQKQAEDNLGTVRYKFKMPCQSGAFLNSERGRDPAKKLRCNFKRGTVESSTSSLPCPTLPLLCLLSQNYHILVLRTIMFLPVTSCKSRQAGQEKITDVIFSALLPWNKKTLWA